jgi:hypothetical protein
MALRRLGRIADSDAPWGAGLAGDQPEALERTTVSYAVGGAHSKHRAMSVTPGGSFVAFVQASDYPR